MQSRILITGASGTVGQALIPILEKQGFAIRMLQHRPYAKSTSADVWVWQGLQEPLPEGLMDGVSGVLHLGGAGIADQAWTAQRKEEILASRIAFPTALAGLCRTRALRFSFFVSASASGWYGQHSENRLHTELEEAANDFLGDTCRQWEAAADLLAPFCNRVVKIRTGIVLSATGGALPAMLRPFRLGLGAVLGNGQQIMPWIHEDDIASVFALACSNPAMQGPYNAVAQNITHRKFCQTLAQVLHKPLWPLAIPSFALRWALGEKAVLLLEGNALSNSRLTEFGYTFQHGELELALRHLLRNR